MAGPVPAIHAFISFRTRGCAGHQRVYARLRRASARAWRTPVSPIWFQVLRERMRSVRMAVILTSDIHLAWCWSPSQFGQSKHSSM